MSDSWDTWCGLEVYRHRLEDALADPVKWCVSGHCKRSHGALDRRPHARSDNCPAFDQDDVQAYLEKNSTYLERYKD